MKKSNLFITWLPLSLAVIALVCSDQAHDDYIDPMDLLNFDPINVRMKKESELTANKVPQPGSTRTVSPTNSESEDESEMFAQKTDSCSAATKLNKIAISLLRKYAMILVNNYERKEISKPCTDINIRLQVNQCDVYKLKQFGQEQTTDIRLILGILHDIIENASDVLPQESNFFWLESRIGLSWPMMFQVLATIICLIALLRVLQQTLITQRLIFQMLLLLFVISVIFAWAEMYQAKPADQENEFIETLDKDCKKPEDQSFLNRAFLFVSSQFTFKSDKCQEYYQNIFVNPIHQVSTMEAITVAVVKTIVSPIGIIGRAISTTLKEVFKDLPIHYQLAVSCVLPLLVIIVLCILRDYQLNLFHLVSIGPGHQPTPVTIGPGHQPTSVLISQRHHPVSNQVQHTEAPATASVPASSQLHQVQLGSLYSVHGTQPDERVHQLSAAKRQPSNAAKHVPNQLQQRSDTHNEKELEPKEGDQIAGGKPGPVQISCHLRDEDREDIRIAAVKTTQAVYLKQEVENKPQRLFVSENQPIEDRRKNNIKESESAINLSVSKQPMCQTQGARGSNA